MRLRSSCLSLVIVAVLPFIFQNAPFDVPAAFFTGPHQVFDAETQHANHHPHTKGHNDPVQTGVVLAAVHRLAKRCQCRQQRCQQPKYFPEQIHGYCSPSSRTLATSSGVIVGASLPQLVRSWLIMAAISSSLKCSNGGMGDP